MNLYSWSSYNLYMDDLLGKIDINLVKQKFPVSIDNVKRIRSFRQSVSRKFKTRFYELEPDWRTKEFNWLSTHQYKNFDLWFDKELIDYKKHSKLLCRYLNGKFDEWWDPDKYDWENYSSDLAFSLSSKFDEWWDPDKYDWKYGSSALASGCRSHFNTWWDENKFNSQSFMSLVTSCSGQFDIWWKPEQLTKWQWNRISEIMPMSYPSKFTTWWDPEKFVYSTDVMYYLFSYCLEYFDDWWLPERIPTKWWKTQSHWLAANHPDLFDKWWDKKKFNYGQNHCSYPCDRGSNRPVGRHGLMKYCSGYFNKWWDRQRIRPNNENFRHLENYCNEHSNMWASDLIIFKIATEGSV